MPFDLRSLVQPDPPEPNGLLLEIKLLIGKATTVLGDIPESSSYTQAEMILMKLQDYIEELDDHLSSNGALPDKWSGATQYIPDIW